MWGERVSFLKLVFLAAALDDIPLHFFPVPKIEGDRPIDLLETKGRIVQSYRFRGFAMLELPDNVGERHTALHQVETPVPLFDVFLGRRHASFQSISISPPLIELKAYASRALNESENASPRRWAHHGSTKYLWNTDQLETALHYVIRQQGEPMALYVNPNHWLAKTAPR